MRQEADKLTYKPGEDQIIDNQFNTWPGWGTEPKEGDVQPFLRLINHLMQGAEDEAIKWLLQWFAYPIQNPGVKMFSSVVFHGNKHGTGKSLIGYTVGQIYGKNFTELSQSDLDASFNEWAENTQFVMGDEITGSNKRQYSDYLKKLITQKEIRINAKHIRSYNIPDCINYFFTSNKADSFFLEDNDRRYFIHDIIADPLRS